MIYLQVSKWEQKTQKDRWVNSPTRWVSPQLVRFVSIRMPLAQLRSSLYTLTAPVSEVFTRFFTHEKLGLLVFRDLSFCHGCFFLETKVLLRWYMFFCCYSDLRLPNTKHEEVFVRRPKHTIQTPWKPQEVLLMDKILHHLSDDEKIPLFIGFGHHPRWLFGILEPATVWLED